MHLHRIICLLMAASNPLLVSSQKLSQQIIESYPNSVIRRVYEVNIRIRLSTERQKQFADFFMHEDSVLVRSIQSGASGQIVTQQINSFKKEIEMLFSKDEWLIYSIAAASAADLYFLNRKLNEIEKIKPLSDRVRQKIYKDFMIRRRSGSTESQDREFFKILQENISDTVYYAALYKDQLNSRVAEYVLAYANFKKYPKQVAKNIMAEVAISVGERQRQWILLDYAMPFNSKEKDDLRSKIGNKFNPVIRKSEIKYGFNTIQSLFTTTYLNRDLLRIDKPLSDSLFNYVAAISIDSFKTKFISDSGLIEWRRFERRKLISLIGEAKYLKALGIENFRQAKSWAEDQWKAFKKYNLHKEIDSTRTIEALSKYQLTLLISKAIYADDPVRGEADLKMIKDRRPEILRTLEMVRANPNSQQAIKSTFTW